MAYVIKGMGVQTIQYGYRFFSESILSGCKPMLSSTSIVSSSRLIVWALIDWVDLITTTSFCRGAAWLLSSDVLTVFFLQDVKILRRLFKPVKSYSLKSQKSKFCSLFVLFIDLHTALPEGRFQNTTLATYFGLNDIEFQGINLVVKKI